MLIHAKTVKNKILKGFTLIELLVVISIIGILVGLSIFGLQGARQASRDAKRKADIEEIRSGIEIYKSDCNSYPIGSGEPTNVLGTELKGSGANSSCSATNTYISNVPQDPSYPNTNYYYSSDGSTYQICGSLEQGSTGTVSCTGSCGSSCNYKVINP